MSGQATILLGALVLACGSTPGLAQPSDDAILHAVGFGVVTTLTGAVGAGLGFSAGLGTSAPKDGPHSGALIGLIGGLAGGWMMGALVYDEVRQGDHSVWRGALGGAVGLMGAFLVSEFDDSLLLPFLTIAAGSGIGYATGDTPVQVGLTRHPDVPSAWTGVLSIRF